MSVLRGVAVGVGVLVGVGVAVGVAVLVTVGVLVGELVAVGIAVEVSVDDGVVVATSGGCWAICVGTRVSDNSACPEAPPELDKGLESTSPQPGRSSNSTIKHNSRRLHSAVASEFIAQKVARKSLAASFSKWIITIDLRIG